MENLIGRHWHHMPAAEVLELLDSNTEKGLDLFEIEHRRKSFGENRISPAKEKGPLLRFMLQFHQPLVYILIVSGFITAFLGEWVDSGVIFGVVMVNAVIGFVQEAKAVSALAALARIMTSETTVLRQGEKRRIPSEEIVPGDIVILQSGDKVPADMRLINVRDLRVDESSLTGESVPVAKQADSLAHETILAERINMSYAATLVTYGQGIGVVTATGDETEVGRISRLIASADALATPLTRKISEFSNVLLYVILALSGVTVVVGLMRGQSFIDMFMAAVALAVGAIPEGLPAAVTVTLAIGVSRMAKQKAIIRKLPAVETLGSTTVICSDKTGTLTENQMTVQKIVVAGRCYTVSGAGYDPDAGDIQAGNEEEKAGKLENSALNLCLKAGAYCNDSTLVEEKGLWRIEGDPTEGALLVSARKGGLNLVDLHVAAPRIDSLPFESEYQYMATLHSTPDGVGRVIYLKGAVEVILGRCHDQIDTDGGHVPLDSGRIGEEVAEMAASGLRVLAFAMKKVNAEIGMIEHTDVMDGLTFIGLQGMLDPPRQEVIRAIRTCRDAGVRVKMITGDHAVTAAAIAGQIGLADNGSVQPADIPVLTGGDLASISDKELLVKVEETVVFARVSPEQKLRLVEALQARGNVVAMTGDGVNDAPALKRADIGIAMGRAGTEVAREAADMILTDDNFSSIEAAVEEGRGVFDNLTKFIVWTLPTNLGEGLVIMAAIFLGVALPILPVQILWINMTTAGFLGLMLAFEPKEPGIMSKAPRNPQTPILTGELIGRIFLVGGLLLVAAFALFRWELARGKELDEARTVAVNVFVVMELFYLFNCRSLEKSIFQLGFFSNIWVLGGVSAMLLLQIAYTYAPLMNRLFQSAPISWTSWGLVAASGILTWMIVETEKWLRRRFRNCCHAR